MNIRGSGASRHKEPAGTDAYGTFQEGPLCCSHAQTRRGALLLAAEHSGWEEAASNAHSALRTPILQKTIRTDQLGEVPQHAGGGQGSVGFPRPAHEMRGGRWAREPTTHPAARNTHERQALKRRCSQHETKEPLKSSRLTLPAAAVVARQPAAALDPNSPLPAAGPSALHRSTTRGRASKAAVRGRDLLPPAGCD
jgi:hypothetical protein